MFPRPNNKDGHINEEHFSSEFASVFLQNGKTINQYKNLISR